MAQWLGALAALLEDQGSTPSTYMAADSHVMPVSEDLTVSTGLLGTGHTHMQYTTGKTPTHIK